VDADLDTLVTALYVKIDDGLVKDRRPGHPVRLSQPELVCLAVAQALLGFHSEHRWIRFASGRSRPAVKRSDMAGWASYGYCASHSRWFWGLRLYLICTPAGMPVLWALADPKIGEREVLAAMLDVEPRLATARPGLALITDKGFAGRETEAGLARRGITLLRPSRKNEDARHGEPLLKAVAAIWHNNKTGAPVTRSLTAYDH
jgi:hypothetical protein